jgi:hypothetical protein
MDEIVIRLRTTHEQNHADSEQGWRATTDSDPRRKSPDGTEAVVRREDGGARVLGTRRWIMKPRTASSGAVHAMN